MAAKTPSSARLLTTASYYSHWSDPSLSNDGILWVYKDCVDLFSPLGGLKIRRRRRKRIIMPPFDNTAGAADGKHDGTPPPAGPAFDGYPKPAGPQPNGDRTGRTADNVNGVFLDASAPGPGTSLRPDQVAFLQSWRAREQAVVAFNAQNDQDGGAHLQNAVYNYTRQILKEEGLDRQGWEAYPTAMNSPLDKIGADIVLVNSKTGDVVLMDPTSRRLDPKTGDRVPESENAKKNVPAIREPGVVDALPRWFERGTGALDLDQEDAASRANVHHFQQAFRDQIHDLTSTPSALNLKDFPIPYYGPVKEQAAQTEQIETVVNWCSKKAGEVARQGDGQTAYLLRDFGTKINGALNYSKRTGSEPLQEAMERNVNRVIADEALRRAYPKLAPQLQDGQRSFRRLEDGSELKTDKSGILVLNLRGKNGPTSDQVITAGSVPDAFARATGYWASAQYDPQKLAEFKALLPGSVVKQIDAGQIRIENILAEIGNNRNEFAGGGAGVDKPLVTRVITRLANQKAEGLRNTISGAATEVTAPAAEAPVAATKAPAPEVRFSPAEVTARPKVETTQTHLGRPQAGANGQTKWEPGTAPAPVVGKVDVPPKEVATTTAPPKPAEVTEHLTAAEVAELQRARRALESKGQANLNAGDKEQIQSFKFAEEQLGKPFGNDPVRRGLVEHIRGLMHTEGTGAVLSSVMIGTALLHFYETQRPEKQDPARAKFY